MLTRFMTIQRSILAAGAVLTIATATAAEAGPRISKTWLAVQRPPSQHGMLAHVPVFTGVKADPIAHAVSGPVKIISRKPPINPRGGSYDPPPNRGSDGGAGTGGGGPNTWQCDANGNCGAYRSS